jgi:predicted RNA-binding Zn ribbon-like protein
MDDRDLHAHQPSLEDGLAFVNTLGYSDGLPEEHLATTQDALLWLHEHGLMHADAMEARVRSLASDPTAAHRTLLRIRRIRSAVRDLIDAAVEDRAPTDPSLAVVNQALRHPYVYQLIRGIDGVSLGHRHDGDPVAGALARLTETVAREVSQGDPSRLRVCANDECRWVFRDSSRSGRRRWCSMATCGNRAKAARHRARRAAD